MNYIKQYDLAKDNESKKDLLKRIREELIELKGMSLLTYDVIYNVIPDISYVLDHLSKDYDEKDADLEYLIVMCFGLLELVKRKEVE